MTRRHWNRQDRTNGQEFRRQWSLPPPPQHYQPPTPNCLPPPPEVSSGVHSPAPTEGAGRGKPPFDAARVPQCYNCKEYGHIARHCQVRWALMNGGSKANKWFLDGAINGVRTNYMFIDTGCEITTVHEKLVPKSAYTGEYSEQIASTGVKTIYPLVKVQLTVLGQPSEQLVNVAPKLLVDVALGQNLQLVDALYNPDMKPAIAMLTFLRSQPRRRCKTSISYQEADEDLDECSSYRDELSSNSDE